ncbi:unnamed protein product [Lactuca saligna]|uniref:Uncharacterized protein n=1 Tax=Lactuca saligna TaxID=75948 RepID=A0AA35VXP0_LACSI|nr:unnamed protein product [Lactuca saligna]
MQTKGEMKKCRLVKPHLAHLNPSSISPKIHQLHPQRTASPLYPNWNLDRFCLRHPQTIVYHHLILVEDMKSHMCNGRESSIRRSHLSDQCFPAKPEGDERGTRVVVASSGELLIPSVDSSITNSSRGHGGAGGAVVAGVPRCRRWGRNETTKEWS